MHKRVSSGILCLFVCCLLLISKWKANKRSDNDSPSPPVQTKYDVFVSFRGSDIRRDFLRHLVGALSRKQIYAFVDDKLLPRGDEISKSLLGAIERSFTSLVIFSQNYTSSPWCLDELVKIIQCRKNDGQIVLPVFYKVDPADVRHQKGIYANEFAEHEKKYNSTKVLAWRSALKESADISGFHSSNFLNEFELVEEIAKCVLMKLDHVHQVDSKGLVGISKHISRVESMLQVKSKDVRAIGIWGMGGTGKTTIAEEVFNRLCSEYDNCCFMANVREEWERHGIINLKKRLFSTLLGKQDLEIDTPHRLPSSVERRLPYMKVLVVLDDVSEPQQLEDLIGTIDRFGTGSRIIITTRNQQVLPKKAEIYVVKGLNSDESFRLFNLNAFEQNHPEMEYHELSKKMVNYANGVPLVIKVLGHHLRGKDKKIWESQLEKLEKMPIKKVHEVISLSYNDLDRDEKEIFLDIACFLDGLHLKVDTIKLLYKDRGYSADVVLESLKSKALVTISRDNVVSVHNIIQESAWEIVREESCKDPGTQSRLMNPDEIYQVLKNNKVRGTARSIYIDMLVNKELQLGPQVFSKMSNLQYLDIYSRGSCNFHPNEGPGIYLPEGLESLPRELRFLHWAHYPLESLPSTFSGEKLVVLNLECSRVKKLWHGDKDLDNLRSLILRSSSNLVELPNLSKATNLEEIDLSLCEGLTSIHPSIFSLNKLEKLDLSGCIALTSLQSNIHLSSLHYLSLYNCTSLKEFSVTSKYMIELNLELTGVKQLPTTIGLQTKLEKLGLAYSNIENLPQSIKHLTRLTHLDLSHCRKLRSLPELPSSLNTLDASGCISLRTVTFPSSIALQQQKENKTRVSFWNCLKLNKHSLKAIGLNAQINMMNFAHQHISTFGHDCDSQGTYVYPGSIVPKWLEYRTARDYMTIDLSFANHSSQLGFIFCFTVPKVASQGFVLRYKIGVGEGEEIQVYLDTPTHGINSNHVYLVYNRDLSRSLNRQVKKQPKFNIKVTGSVRLSRGFGVSPINSSQYLNFIQRMELADDPRSTTSKLIFCLLIAFFMWLLIPIFIIYNHQEIKLGI